jgi:protein-S-isoprenylcysteine O-methyltransferase Ste14
VLKRSLGFGGPPKDKIGHTMNDLHKKAFSGLFVLVLALAGLLFLPAWTLDYWQAWVFLAVFSVSVFAITVYLMKNDPKLLERRVHAGSLAEKATNQKLIQLVAQIAFIATIVVPAVDHRFAWSAVPVVAVSAGDILVVLGLLFVFLVFRENTFASAIIEVDRGQKVISTGPYARIRHPMYAGAIVMLLGVPLALGSWWGLCGVCLMIIVIAWRLLDEEKFLARNLSGYSEYQNNVKYRLAPYIW